MIETDSPKKAKIPSPTKYTRRQLNALYRAIPLKDTTFRLLRKYFCAMVNLYGIISLKKAYEIILKQNPGIVTKEQFIAFAEIARHEEEDYSIFTEVDLPPNGIYTPPLLWELVDWTLLHPNRHDYLQQKKAQNGKPYYIPEKRILLNYADCFYCEPSDELDSIQHFLADKFSKNGESSVFPEVLYGIRYMNVTLPRMLEHLCERGYAFESKKDVAEFTELYQKFFNNARMQCHRGYTPNEIRKFFPSKEQQPCILQAKPQLAQNISSGIPDTKALQQNLLTMDFPDKGIRSLLTKGFPTTENSFTLSKPGRNDPCPCGSGKKYKKCCGRNSI